MFEEILINVMPHETRAAIVMNGLLQALWVERASRATLVGNIYRGKVVKILPGMQSAFVEIGLERAGFLHVTDLIDNKQNDIESEPDGQAETKPINAFLTEGQALVVQVMKDPRGKKGARLSTQISLVSRNLVFMPYSQHVGVSLKIEDDAERERLKALVGEQALPEQGGAIVRTAADGATSLAEDQEYLTKLWAVVQEKIQTTNDVSLLHQELPVAQRVCRDMMGPNTEQIQVDHEPTYQALRKFLQTFMPTKVEKLIYYDDIEPMFDAHRLEDEIDGALARKIPLESGGYLVFDQTEALTTIDVNTGGFVGKQNLDETILKTNLEAANTIAAQLRVRNIGGIIIIDFIDMEIAEHREKVSVTLEEALKLDPMRTRVSEISSLGLVQMTRKRNRESLQESLCTLCWTCQGRGIVKTEETLCNEIFRDALRKCQNTNPKKLQITAHRSVVERLKAIDAELLGLIKEKFGVELEYKTETQSRERFDVVAL